VSAVLVGEHRIPVLSAGAATLADAVRSAQPRWCAGARWSTVINEDARTVVCTDFPTMPVRQHFPVLAIATDPRLQADCAVLRPPRPGADLAAELLGAPAVLEQIAVSLLRRLM